MTDQSFVPGATVDTAIAEDDQIAIKKASATNAAPRRGASAPYFLEPFLDRIIGSFIVFPPAAGLSPITQASASGLPPSWGDRPGATGPSDSGPTTPHRVIGERRVLAKKELRRT